jgi:demethylmenaquinone methyltransferase/2-methoxy-6-polyprenyl-1,4-benzoquinol methylase
MSIVFMKVLESSANRYDRGIQIITLGVIKQIYQDATDGITEGQKVLDIGCGTGSLSFLAAAKGAIVTGIDINPEMLHIAELKGKELNLSKNVTFIEMGVAQLDKFDDTGFDIVSSGLCFSELSDDERKYTMKHIIRLLSKHGKFILIEEVVPNSILKKILFWMLRIPLIILTYIFTQTTTKPLSDLDQYITENGFVAINRLQKGNLVAIISKKQDDEL